MCKSIPCLFVISLTTMAIGFNLSAFTAENTSAEYLNSPGTEALGLPFSEAVRVGNTLYVAGQLGLVRGKLELVGGGIRAETKQAMENMKAILERNGSSMNDVVKCTVFLADMKEFPIFNEVYRPFFPVHFPARSTVGASGLALGGRIEIECIAVIPAKKK
jgi:2-iminobutanoate/2-iminopropanoate deaminase